MTVRLLDAYGRPIPPEPEPAPQPLTCGVPSAAAAPQLLTPHTVDADDTIAVGFRDDGSPYVHVTLDGLVSKLPLFSVLQLWHTCGVCRCEFCGQGYDDDE